MLEKIKTLQAEAVEKVGTASSLPELESIKVDYLGKKGHLTEILKGMRDLSSEEKPKIGAAANVAKTAIQNKIEIRKQNLAEIEI